MYSAAGDPWASLKLQAVTSLDSGESNYTPGLLKGKLGQKRFLVLSVRRNPKRPDDVTLFGNEQIARQVGLRIHSVASLLYGNFGYSRSSTDGTVAMLWLYQLEPYGKNKSLGLDLVDASTGELSKDGIPDCIVMVIKLEKGRIANVNSI